MQYDFTLTPDEQELVQRQRQWLEGNFALIDSMMWGSRGTTLDQRKCAALDRRLILRGDFEDLVARKVDLTHYDATLRSRLKRHLDVSINVGRDITTAVACVYKLSARRTLRKASRAKREALAELNKHRRIDTIAPELNRTAFLVGPTLEVPIATPRGVRSAIITPDRYDASLDPLDPFGPPIRVAYTWPNDEGELEIIVLDEDSRTRYTAKGELIGTEEHGIVDANGDPMLPATVWRSEHPTDFFDWWCWRRHLRLVHATVNCAVVHTQMGFVRKTQNKKFTTFFARLSNFPKNQLIDAERPLGKDLDSSEPTPQFDVHDFDTPVENFIQHIMFEYRTQIEAFGIPQSSLTFDFGHDGGTPAASLAIQHERLAQLRNEQIPHMREAEARSQYVAAAVAARAGMTDLEPEEVADRFAVEFPELNRIDEPDRLHAWWDWQIGRGQKTEIDIRQSTHPEETDEESKAAVMANLEAQADLNEFKASRRLNTDQRMESEPEATGAMRSDPQPEESDTDGRDPSASD